jgi:hypothetical protein
MSYNNPYIYQQPSFPQQPILGYPYQQPIAQPYPNYANSYMTQPPVPPQSDLGSSVAPDQLKDAIFTLIGPILDNIRMERMLEPELHQYFRDGKTELRDELFNIITLEFANKSFDDNILHKRIEDGIRNIVKFTRDYVYIKKQALPHIAQLLDIIQGRNTNMYGYNPYNQNVPPNVYGVNNVPPMQQNPLYNQQPVVSPQHNYIGNPGTYNPYYNNVAPMQQNPIFNQPPPPPPNYMVYMGRQIPAIYNQIGQLTPAYLDPNTKQWMPGMLDNYGNVIPTHPTFSNFAPNMPFPSNQPNQQLNNPSYTQQFQSFGNTTPFTQTQKLDPYKQMSSMGPIAPPDPRQFMDPSPQTQAMPQQQQYFNQPQPMPAQQVQQASPYTNPMANVVVGPTISAEEIQQAKAIYDQQKTQSVPVTVNSNSKVTVNDPPPTPKQLARSEAARRSIDEAFNNLIASNGKSLTNEQTSCYNAVKEALESEGHVLLPEDDIHDRPSPQPSKKYLEDLKYARLDTYSVEQDFDFVTRISALKSQTRFAQAEPQPIESWKIISPEEEASLRFVLMHHTSGWNDEEELFQNMSKFELIQKAHVTEETHPNAADPLVISVQTHHLTTHKFDYPIFEAIRSKLNNVITITDDSPLNLADKVLEILDNAPANLSSLLTKRIVYTWKEFCQNWYIPEIYEEHFKDIPLDRIGLITINKMTMKLTASEFAKKNPENITMLNSILMKAIRHTIDITNLITVCDPDNEFDIPDIIHANGTFVNIRNTYTKYHYGSLLDETAATDKEEFIRQLKRFVVFKEPIKYLFYRPNEQESFFPQIKRDKVIDLKREKDPIPNDMILLHKAIKETVINGPEPVKVIFFDDEAFVVYNLCWRPDDHIELVLDYAA